MEIIRRDLELFAPASKAAAALKTLAEHECKGGEDGCAECREAETEAAAQSRVRTFILSTPAVDSYNTTIKQDGWVLDRFNRNPVVPLNHNYRSFPIAKGRAYLDGDKLMLDADFAPADDPIVGKDAEQALRWVDRGVLGASVGFKPLESEYNEDRETGDIWEDLFNPPVDYLRQELVEASVVIVPANAEAVGVGRQMLARMAPRYAERLNGLVARRGAKPTARIGRSDIERLVREATRDEVRAAMARNTGNLSGG